MSDGSSFIYRDMTIPYIQHKKVSDSYKKAFAPQECYSDLPGKERAAYITDNTDALKYRLKMIREAKEEVILSTFDFNADTGGKDVMSALIEAAHRDVHVRLIVDGISGFLDMKGDPYFQALADTEHIEVKIYNPVNLLKPWTMQARLHDKYVIVDSSMYLLGGRNTASLFLGNSCEKAEYRQRDFYVHTAGRGKLFFKTAEILF